MDGIGEEFEGFLSFRVSEIRQARLDKFLELQVQGFPQ
jgi:hypothetical protein